ncbi:MAG: HD family phosphohydrolase [Candidatus Rokuibacteriota bacterium]|nr:MAG: HD family phosphohydrolase [Candidatus Rokubacteria bacterium]
MRRRRVLYDATSRAAATAAESLRGDFDVAGLSVAADPTADGPVVVLVGRDATDSRWGGAPLRVVALVDGGGAGPWPAHWYSVLPEGVSAAMLARAIDKAFADLDRAAEMARLDRELSELNAIGIRLSAERNPRDLIETILTKAREITQSDAGSLYLVEEEPDGTRDLRFVLAQNDSVDLPFHAARLPLTSESVAGHVALTGAILNLEDAYSPPAGAPFHINRSFDEETGYRTRSMLVVPMRTPEGETIGALQLINCKPDFAARLRPGDPTEQMVQRFTARHEQLAGSLASQAAVAIQNRRLYESIRDLFEGFVKASVTAIESRDPTTSGHSARVANMTVGLATAIDRGVTGPYQTLRFTAEEMTELRYAALLHDFGKVGVREQVLVKAKKLLPGELDRIRQRVELIRRGLELRYAGKKIEHLFAKGRRGYARQAATFDAELAAYVAMLDQSIAHIVAANEPAVLPRDFAAGIERLALDVFEDHLGNRETVITREEAEILAIPRGSLTPAEFKEIQSHVIHTYEFLTRIPWTREFRGIPAIARSHHEKLDGTGYPEGREGEEIPVQSRMMTIADIYDALTAGDRPYKKGIAPAEALGILEHERRAGHLDGALLDVFVDAKIYEQAQVPAVSPAASDRRHPMR